MQFEKGVNEKEKELTLEKARALTWREHAGKLENNTLTRTVPRPRPWAWIFAALHSAAKAREPSGMRLRMADTILFHRGRPTKWLVTDEDGCVTRRNLANAFSSRAASSATYRNGSRAPPQGRAFEIMMVKEQMKTIREALVRFSGSQSMSLALLDSDNIEAIPEDRELDLNGDAQPLATAWYTDGLTEHLHLHTFDMLVEHDDWLHSLTALQA